MDIFTVTLGLCSENRVAYDEFSRSFVNTASVGRVRIWLGEGDICLCSDVRQGRIAGMGKHSELMENCEVYRQIAFSQLSKEELA